MFWDAFTARLGRELAELAVIMLFVVVLVVGMHRSKPRSKP